jgi:hypothetical protein
MRCASRPPESSASGLRVLAALGTALALACSLVPERLPLPSWGPRLTEEELRAQVLEASSRFTVAITSAADAIETESTSPLVRKRALLWKVRMTPVVQRAASSPKATEGLLALMALAAAQELYLNEGNGASLFGEWQEVARQTSREVREDLASLPGQLLEAREAESLVAEVEQLSRRHPIVGEFEIATPQSVRADLKHFSSLQTVLNVPLSPFRALEGVESGAGAIHEFNGTARQFNELLNALPQQARWQLQLLLYDLEGRESLQRGLASMERIAESAERFSSSFEQLPTSTREAFTELLDDAALDRAEVMLRNVESATVALEGAGNAWRDVVRDVKGGRDSAPAVSAAPRSPGRPFDIREYESTAREVGAAAVEVRGALAEVGAAAVEIRRALAELPSGGASSALVDAIFWRFAALMCLAFALMLAYRLLVRRHSDAQSPTASGARPR